MKSILSGIGYNFRGLKFGIKTPSLLVLGLTRLAVILFLTILAVGMILVKYQEIANVIWTRPESAWLVWLWYVAAGLLALLLAGISAVLAFLASQVLFSVVIMDYMSRITEKRSSGRETGPPRLSWIGYFLFLLKQEVPRAILPICISLAVMVLGWMTPLSPFLTILSPVLTGVFLAWDNTDLVPARRLVPFGERFGFMRRHLGFHLGFGLCFLIPGVNILLLSFAPVGATLYYLEKVDAQQASQP